MPKQKTRQAAAKRFKVTANGKIMHYRSGNSHLQTHKSSQRKRQKRKEKELTGEDKKRVKQMLPNA